MWRVIPGQSLVYRRWGEEAVLYNDLSGATHLLGAAALCLLEALRVAPASTEMLTMALLAEYDESDLDIDSVGQEISSVLDSLARLSLVEPCPCRP